MNRREVLKGAALPFTVGCVASDTPDKADCALPLEPTCKLPSRIVGITVFHNSLWIATEDGLFQVRDEREPSLQRVSFF